MPDFNELTDMSHHILHVFQHGAILGRERGFITCRADGQDERRLPLDDIRAVIIAARGVTLTSSFLSGLMENVARLWLERAGEAKRAFFQVFRKLVSPRDPSGMPAILGKAFLALKNGL